MKSLGQNATQTELEDIVNEVDVNHSGTIDFNGTPNLPPFTPLNPPYLSPIQPSSYLSITPYIHTYVSFFPTSEFLAMMTRVTKQEDTDEELRRAFQVFDRDNSGHISTKELRDVLKSVGEDLNDAEIDEMMRQVDVDGSGEIDCRFFPVFLDVFGGVGVFVADLCGCV